MLVIGSETKAAFQQDSSHKELNIEICNNRIRDYNFYKGSMNNFGELTTIAANGGQYQLPVDNSPSFVYDATNKFNVDYITYRKYVCVGYRIHFYNTTSAPDTLVSHMVYKGIDGRNYIQDIDITVSEASGEGNYVFVKHIYNVNSMLFAYPLSFTIENTSDTAFNGGLYIDSWILECLDDSSEFPVNLGKGGIGNRNISSEVITIDAITNKNIAFESFSMTESLCSQDNMKFGLCEASNCKFDVVGINENLNGITIKPKILAMRDSDYVKMNWCSGKNPEGHNVIWNNSRLENISYYANQLAFRYPEEKVKGYIPENFRTCVVTFDVKITTITMPSGTDEPYLLWFGVRGWNAGGENKYYWKPENYIKVSDLKNDFVRIQFTYDNIDGITNICNGIDGIAFAFYDENKEQYESGTITRLEMRYQNVQVNMVPNTYTEIPPFDADNAYAYNNELNNYINGFKVALGVYNITEVKTEHTLNKITKHITAYDNKLKLEQNAANWYKSYMYCPTWWFKSEDRPRRLFGYPKQIYASFFNYAKSVGLEFDNYGKELIIDDDGTNDFYWNTEQLPYHEPEVHNNDYYLDFYTLDGGLAEYTTLDTACCYQVVLDFPNESIEDYYNNRLPYYTTDVDSLGRGMRENSSILIDVKRGNTVINTFSINSGDYFMINPDATNISIRVAGQRSSNYSPHPPASRLVDRIRIYKVDYRPNLVNGWLPVRFFSEFATDEGRTDFHNKIFACESSITGRDVVRSLLEPCGCFFGLSRYDAKPLFIYCTKSGLYPSNTLYPADDLYPRGGVDGENVPLGKYMSLMFDDYSVKDYGRIQILKKVKSNDNKSVVEWEYVGSATKPNTYLIDDNIFYCAEEMEYEYDSMYDVSEMLENMYNQISNMGYTPNTTVALGLPWLEVGDRVGMLTHTGGAESFIFRRTLTGIQMLTDTYESSGDEITEAIKDYGYTLIN